MAQPQQLLVGIIESNKVVKWLNEDPSIIEKLEELATWMNINPKEWTAMQQLRSGMEGLEPTPQDSPWVLLTCLLDLWTTQEGKMANAHTLLNILQNIGSHDCADKISSHIASMNFVNLEKVFITSKDPQAFINYLTTQVSSAPLVWAFPLNQEIQKIPRLEAKEGVIAALNDLFLLEGKKLMIYTGPGGSGKEELLFSAFSSMWELGKDNGHPHIFWVKAENAHNIWTFIKELTAFLGCSKDTGFHSKIPLTLVEIVAEIEKHLLLRYNYLKPSIKTVIVFCNVRELYPELLQVVETLQTLNVVSTILCTDDVGIFAEEEIFLDSMRFEVVPPREEDVSEFARNLGIIGILSELWQLQFNFSAIEFASDFIGKGELDERQYLKQLEEKTTEQSPLPCIQLELLLLLEALTPEEVTLVEILAFINDNVRIKESTLKQFYNLGNSEGNFEQSLSTMMKYGILEMKPEVEYLYPKSISFFTERIKLKSDCSVAQNILRNLTLTQLTDRNSVLKILSLWNNCVTHLADSDLDALSPVSEQISDHLIQLDFISDCLVYSRDNALKMGEKLGENHLQIIALEHNLAYVTRKWDKWEEGLDLFRKVYDKFLNIIGPEGEYCLVTMRNLADSLTHLGKHDEAVEWRSLEVDLRGEGDTSGAKGRLGLELILTREHIWLVKLDFLKKCLIW